MATIPVPPTSTTDAGDRRRRSYAAGASLSKDRLRREDPLSADALAAVEAADIVVVPGQYDHVEQVLGALEVPFTRIRGGSLRRVNLRPEQLLVVNCPGNLSAPDIVAVRDFVEAGGSLFTTDWALRNVIEPAFPGVLAYNNQPTADAVVRIEILDRKNDFLRGVMDEADDPQWWLEGSSYPITVLDPDRVEVLITSKELEAQWGEAAVAVLFRHGQGEVFHMISHYFLQRTELRDARHRQKAETLWDEKGVGMPSAIRTMSEDLDLGEVESSYSSARLFANIVADKKRRSTRPRPAQPGGASSEATTDDSIGDTTGDEA
jgi:hypothetical protein